MHTKGELKIKTPYGEKNWSFVKRVFDSHDDLLGACENALLELLDNGFYEKDFICIQLKQAINKAKGV